jgi:hypothetical protein
MSTGIAALILANVLSLSCRAFLAVPEPMMQADLGATAVELADASGWRLLAFSAMQLPIGAGLDKIGPCTTAGVMKLVGALDAALFTMATAAWQTSLATALIGVGCAPVLMANYFIFSRSLAQAVFGVLAIGAAQLWVGLAMVAGNFAHGALDSRVGIRRWVILGGNGLTFLCLPGPRPLPMRRR